MRLLVLTAAAILGFASPLLAQDANPVIPFVNIVGNLIQQKMQAVALKNQQKKEEEALKNSPDAVQPGGLTRAQVMIVQQKLIDRGYDVGAPDGIVGPKTMAVVATLQSQVGTPITGYPTPQLMEALLQQ